MSRFLLYLLIYLRTLNQKKKKTCGCGKYFKKEQNQEFTIIYYRRCVPIIENRISGYLYNEIFSKVIKKNVRTLKVWLAPLLVIKILLKTAELLSKHFPSGLSLFVSFIYSKGKYTSAIPQPSVQHLVYVFLIFFRFYKFFLLKHVFLHSFNSMTQGSCRFLFEFE